MKIINKKSNKAIQLLNLVVLFFFISFFSFGSTLINCIDTDNYELFQKELESETNKKEVKESRVFDKEFESFSGQDFFKDSFLSQRDYNVQVSHLVLVYSKYLNQLPPLYIIYCRLLVEYK